MRGYSNERMPIKSKLFDLKEWLTVPETALHLTKMWGEEVNEADLLRLALDGYLKLSIKFKNRVLVGCVEIVPHEFEILSQAADEDAFEFLKFKKERSLKLCRDREYISGIWDLPLIGYERDCVENIYEHLTNGSKRGACDPYTFVEAPDGKLYITDDPYDMFEGRKRKTLRYDEKNRFTLWTYGLIIVRKQALINLNEHLSKNKKSALDPASTIPFLDDRHPFYPEELHIAVEAWMTLFEKNPSRKKPDEGYKNYIVNWLKENFSDVGERRSDRISIMINPCQKKYIKKDTLNAPADIPFLDVEHEFYAEELRIAVEAWIKLYEKTSPQKKFKLGHRMRIEKFLKEKYSKEKYRKFGDTKFMRIATVINPNSKGGLPKSGS